MNTHEIIQEAIETLRRAILCSETTGEDIRNIERIQYQLREIQNKYRASR